MLAVIIPVLTIPMAWVDNYISCNKTVCGRKLDLLTLKKNIDSSRLRLRLFVPLWKAVCLFVFLYLWAPEYINRDCSDKSGLLLLQLLHPFHKSSLCVNTVTTLLFLLDIYSASSIYVHHLMHHAWSCLLLLLLSSAATHGDTEQQIDIRRAAHIGWEDTESGYDNSVTRAYDLGGKRNSL